MWVAGRVGGGGSVWKGARGGAARAPKVCCWLALVHRVLSVQVACCNMLQLSESLLTVTPAAHQHVF